MATFVLVHGAGHGGWCFGPLARLLRRAGHEVFTPTLTGLGERAHLLSPGITLDTHIDDVAATIACEDLRDVILCGHSYGGMVITGVADRIGGHIARLVYLDATLPRDGECLLEASPGLALFADVRDVDGVRLGLWPETVAGPIYGLSPDDGWACDRLAPHPWATFETPLRLADPARVAAMPRAFINCAATMARRDAAAAARLRDGDFVREIDAPHDLMLSHPVDVAAMLCEIAGLA